MANQQRSDWRPIAATLFDVCGARAMIKQLRSGMGQGHIKITRLLHFMKKATSCTYWSFLSEKKLCLPNYDDVALLTYIGQLH